MKLCVESLFVFCVILYFVMPRSSYKAQLSNDDIVSGKMFGQTEQCVKGTQRKAAAVLYGYTGPAFWRQIHLTVKHGTPSGLFLTALSLLLIPHSSRLVHSNTSSAF